MSIRRRCVVSKTVIDSLDIRFHDRSKCSSMIVPPSDCVYSTLPRVTIHVLDFNQVVRISQIYFQCIKFQYANRNVVYRSVRMSGNESNSSSAEIQFDLFDFPRRWLCLHGAHILRDYLDTLFVRRKSEWGNYTDKNGLCVISHVGRNDYYHDRWITLSYGYVTRF